MEGAAGRDEGSASRSWTPCARRSPASGGGLDPSFTVERERERRQNAEQLRGRPRGHPRLRAPRRGARRGAEAARPGGARGLRPGGGRGAGGRPARRGRERSRGARASWARSSPTPASTRRGEERRAVRVARRRGRGAAGARRRAAPALVGGASAPPGGGRGGDACGRPPGRSTPSPTRTCCAPRRWPSGPRRRCAASSCRTRCAVTRRCSSRWWRSTSGSSAARAPTRSPPRSSRGRAASAATAGGCSSCRRRGGRWWPRAPGDALAGAVGRPAPADLAVGGGAPPLRRPDAGRGRVARHGAAGRAGLSSCRSRRADGWVGCLALLDPNGESPEDRLLEAYASRAAAAWRHAAPPGRDALSPSPTFRFPSRSEAPEVR